MVLILPSPLVNSSYLSYYAILFNSKLLYLSTLLSLEINEEFSFLYRDYSPIIIDYTILGPLKL